MPACGGGGLAAGAGSGVSQNEKDTDTQLHRSPKAISSVLELFNTLDVGGAWAPRSSLLPPGWVAMKETACL